MFFEGERIPSDRYTVYAGSTQTFQGVQRQALYTTVHSGYDSGTEAKLHDIAIIGLVEPLYFDDTIQSLPLAPSGLTLGPGSK